MGSGKNTAQWKLICIAKKERDPVEMVWDHETETTFYTRWDPKQILHHETGWDPTKIVYDLK